MTSVIKLAFAIIFVNVLKFSLSAGITFANSSDPDQAQQNVRPNLDTHGISVIFLKMVILKKILQMAQNHKFIQHLTLKALIMTAADYKFCDIFPNFRKK